ncbi:malate synthase A [Solimonas fluminis]|uniref:malate synthase n=1 Tax=Solimonas fluminis TaxID=2086571 RepID=A0A2S5TE72_9GAMM|nr:malate synthase A [Solimonas fluminis]PPE73148.1 malate synthase A [Solimonas fluminis]
MSAVKGVEILGQMTPAARKILTPDALKFVAKLVRKHAARREVLMAYRDVRQAAVDAGKLKLGFLKQTKKIRDGKWKIAGIPADLQDRRVEITGPVDRKMIINALNSGAKCFMADFEDSASPTWELMIDGQVNLYDAVRRKIAYTSPEGKDYKLGKDIATLIVRPRGWHLLEKHILVDGEPAPGGIVDFALYFFHNAKELLKRGSGPYFYLPKMQSHLEARLWNSIFKDAQAELKIPQKTIKATVLIETIWASFEMDEILYELRDHIVALNCGRWDYIFSFIKTYRAHADRIIPDRLGVTMDKHFLDSYSKLLCQTTHKRGAQAMGGMAAFIPTKDAAKNEEVFAKVRADKLREVNNGHDGTWVAHPGLVQVAMAVFDEHMPTPNQIDKKFADRKIKADDLLKLPEGQITEAGLRNNINVGVQYLEAWIKGNGCVPLHNLMEDAATAEISRVQVWQWLKYNAKLADGRHVTRELVLSIIDEELAGLRKSFGDERYYKGRYAEAAGMFARMSTASQCADFLTLPAYEYLN